MRFIFILFVMILFWSVMIFRLYDVSIKSNFYYEKLAKENIERKSFLKPVRGEITDINGKLLAMNQIGFSLSLAPHISQKNGMLEQLINRIIKIFPTLDKKLMLKVYKKKSSPYNHKYIKVVDFIHYADMMGSYPYFNLFKNVKIEAQTQRYYPYGKYAGHIVGYTGRSNRKDNEKDEVVNIVGKVGKSGLERYYNKMLQGELGFELSKVNARNKAVKILEKEAPKENRNIKLNIDIALQKMIYDRFNKDMGVAIVMRTNGEILSAVSYPSYDPNLFVGGISVKAWKALQTNPAHPFTNKFIHGTYPPGSTIKMGMALASAKAFPKEYNSLDECKGYITVGKSTHKFRCWAKKGHGYVKLKRAIKESCDVYFYNKSLKLGINNMAKSFHSFGLGIKTGVDLPREYNGVIPDKSWKMRRFRKPWYQGETVIASIGQGYDLVTPLQVARYTAMLATSYLPVPHIAKIVDDKNTSCNMKKIVLDAKTLSLVREAMYAVCNIAGGTAFRTMHNLPIKVAGKTGTSQVTSIPQDTKKRLKEHELAYFHRSHAWLTTYAPYDNPKFIVTVLVEHGGHGGSTCGPIVADIYKWMYKKGYFDENITIKAFSETNSSFKIEDINRSLGLF